MSELIKKLILPERQKKGVLAVFDSQNKLLKAIGKVRDTRVSQMDAFTPFPVHGIEKALGLKRSFIPYMTLLFGLTGATLGFLLQYWTSAVDWPINIGGKPYNSWPAFVPVTFEVTILLASVLSVILFFAICKLPYYGNPVLDERLTNDHFGLFIESDDPYFDGAKLNDILKECDVREIKNIQ